MKRGVAAAHADEPLRSQLLTKGEELANRAWADLLRFESRHAARAVAIMMTEGTRDEWFRHHKPVPAPRPTKTFDFGPPLEEVLASCEAENGLAAPKPAKPLRWSPLESRESATARVRNG